jgi:hypothetical protein
MRNDSWFHDKRMPLEWNRTTRNTTTTIKMMTMTTPKERHHHWLATVVFLVVVGLFLYMPSILKEWLPSTWPRRHRIAVVVGLLSLVIWNVILPCAYTAWQRQILFHLFGFVYFVEAFRYEMNDRNLTSGQVLAELWQQPIGIIVFLIFWIRTSMSLQQWKVRPRVCRRLPYLTLLSLRSRDAVGAKVEKQQQQQ